ncbi:MAG: hypothetical protein ABIJ16_13225, partial [Bacteroidota bacterium]
MTTNIQKMLQKITISNPNWRTLYRKLRVNNKIIDTENFDAPPFYHYQNAHLIQRSDKAIYWTAITVVGRKPQIELHNRAKFDIQGNFIDGIVNTFSFGMVDMDEEYIKEYFEEIKDKCSSD